MTRPQTCPKCRSTAIVPIVWGYPTLTSSQLVKEKKAELGGCIIIGDPPLWRCTACRYAWSDVDMALDIYSILYGLPRHTHSTPESELPLNGVYIFFEEGEVAEWKGRSVPTIVRVGTHDVDGRFRKRILLHYSGSKHNSVFRRHVGGALLRQANPHDTRAREWVKKGGRFPAVEYVEERVSERLCRWFTFSCLKVDSARDRNELERLLIACLFNIGWLSRRPLG